ncbi:type II toxin-antitoxin system VapC family toxin [Roseiflexus castenholzii]|uniref:PilT protein domain protein n=1 Tax=Roseiflexus castenholzii (strain DSM 13941 / HLO8) TaxID=383372 RepID=A7NSB2_ROSCS|nr:type II toxin-antitoxin system VapC family toxin [Roseiflexus castenholzii]ABU60458.1 PilT protein domain protein [Roseiflexus castenholzii DSM 13941]
MSVDQRFVLDASITLAWCFEDESSDLADVALDRLAQTSALVPAIWSLEIGSALLGAERRGRLSQAESNRFLWLIRVLPIEIEALAAPRMLSNGVALAREQGRSTYDAAYLELAMRNGLPPATLDTALQRAAKRCGVHLIPITCDHPAWSPRAARGFARDLLRFLAAFTLSEAKGSE